MAGKGKTLTIIYKDSQIKISVDINGYVVRMDGYSNPQYYTTIDQLCRGLFKNIQKKLFMNSKSDLPLKEIRQINDEAVAKVRDIANSLGTRLRVIVEATEGTV